MGQMARSLVLCCPCSLYIHHFRTFKYKNTSIKSLFLPIYRKPVICSHSERVDAFSFPEYFFRLFSYLAFYPKLCRKQLNPLNNSYDTLGPYKRVVDPYRQIRYHKPAHSTGKEVDVTLLLESSLCSINHRLHHGQYRALLAFTVHP